MKLTNTRTEEARCYLEDRTGAHWAVERIWLAGRVQAYGYRAYRTDVRDTLDVTMSTLRGLVDDVITQYHRNSFRA